MNCLQVLSNNGQGDFALSLAWPPPWPCQDQSVFTRPEHGPFKLLRGKKAEADGAVLRTHLTKRPAQAPLPSPPS